MRNWAVRRLAVGSFARLDVPMLPKKGLIIVRQPIAKKLLINLVGFARSLEVHADSDCDARMI
jgi:hypothetical protein